MTRNSILRTALAALALHLAASSGFSEEASALKCFYTGLPAKPGLNVDYEGIT